MNRKQVLPVVFCAGLSCGLALAQAPAGGSDAGQIVITPAESQKAIEGAADRFTGSVRVQSLFAAKPPGRASGGQVTFQPGARSAWHTHPLGQALIVTEGTGWVQQWGGPVQVMRKGDVIWIPPGTKHWHGATPTTSVTHIAIQEEQNGVNVNWMEKVSDEQYGLGK
jgi:quercetin dioxygenase-like cupin family protein